MVTKERANELTRAVNHLVQITKADTKQKLSEVGGILYDIQRLHDGAKMQEEREIVWKRLNELMDKAEKGGE